MRQLKSKITLASFVFAALAPIAMQAQFAEDALRFSEIGSQGTARFQGLGGAHTSIGGDPTSLTSNPAGLGFYTRDELSISLGNDYLHSNSNYLGQNVTDKNNSFNLKNFSLVISNDANDNGYSRSPWKTTMGISFNRQNTFNRVSSFRGRNENSAFIDHIVDRANYDSNGNLNPYTEDELNAGYYKNPSTGKESYDLLEGVYYNLYMFDPVEDQNGKLSYVATEAAGAVEQSGYFKSSGSHSQWTFGFAGNYEDKLYLGISIGVPKVTSSTSRILDETYTAAQVFRSSRYWETVDITGNGYNATIGAIYKVNPMFQLGANVSTPTFMKYQRSLYDGASVERLVNGGNFPTDLSTNPWDYEYKQTTPFRGSIGGTVFLPGQIGFITASADFVGYKGMNLKPLYGNRNEMDVYNDQIKDWYKNVVNPKIGAELRKNNFRVRAGFAYYVDPYKGKIINDLKEHSYNVSGGLGYRGSGFYVDLAVIHGQQKSPFVLYSNGNAGVTTFKNTTSMLTFGVNF